MLRTCVVFLCTGMSILNLLSSGIILIIPESFFYCLTYSKKWVEGYPTAFTHSLGNPEEKQMVLSISARPYTLHIVLRGSPFDFKELWKNCEFLLKG